MRPVVVPYRPEWRDQFRAEAERITEALGTDLVALAHVGSTSVPGLAAKPVIDILVGLRSREPRPEVVAALRALGYRPRHRIGRRYFRKGVPVTHVLHAVEYAAAEWHAKLAFRDYLRMDHEAAAAYAQRKLALAAAETRGGYSRGKARFMRELETSIAYQQFVSEQARSPSL